ncbi:MAG: hypothetical protein RLZZ524_344, partial [Pseudomonadota bacterium]
MRVAEARFDWDEYSFELAFAELEKELTEVYRGIAV